MAPGTINVRLAAVRRLAYEAADTGLLSPELAAGRRKSGKTRRGNRWLRRALNQAAWAAARTKNTYLAARFHRLAAKRGSKRAIVAIGHKILVLAHYMLQHNTPFRELGAEYYQRLRAPSFSQSLVRRLQHLGFQVTLTPTQQVS